MAQTNRMAEWAETQNRVVGVIMLHMLNYYYVEKKKEFGGIFFLREDTERDTSDRTRVRRESPETTHTLSVCVERVVCVCVCV